MKSSSIRLRIAAVSGFLGVALGAFGAHALKEQLAAGGYLDTWKTAVLYHLVHGAVLLVLALNSSTRFHSAYWVVLSGMVIFCGSLYLLALLGMSWMGAITPIGGVALLAGWGLIYIQAGKR